MDLLIVKKGSVSAVEILKKILSAVEGYLGMVTANRSIVDMDIAVRMSSDNHRIFAERASFVLDGLVE